MAEPNTSASQHERLRALFLEMEGLAHDDREVSLAALRSVEPVLAAELERLLSAADTRFLEHPLPAFESTDAPGWARDPQRKRLGPYRLISVLGEGSSGIVYLAEQDQPRRRIALKALRLEALSRAGLGRFRREAEVLARLSHPGIVRVYATGIERNGAVDEPWIAMEYVPGSSLAEHARTVQLDVRAKVALVVDLAETVHAAHSSGIVHRDLKPENVRVEPCGRVRVLDFGVAHVARTDTLSGSLHTRTGELIGTLAYMSPEQARGRSQEVDARTDVFALGTMLYELLSGRLPFETRGAPVHEAVRAILEQEPARLRGVHGIDRDIETIVFKSLEKDPERRCQHAGELASELRRWLDGRPIHSRPPTLAYRTRKLVERNRVQTAAVLAVFLALSLGLVLALRGEHRAREQAARTGETLEALAAKIFDFAPTLGFGEEQRADLEDVLARIQGQLAFDRDNRALRASCSNALYILGVLDQARGDHAGLAVRMEAARALRTELASESDDLESRTRLSQIYAKLGEAARDRGDQAGRDEWFARALEQDEVLVREHPDDLELVEDLGWSLSRVAQVAKETGELRTAEQLLQQRLNDALRLVELEPENWKFTYNLSHAHYELARLYLELGQSAQGLEHSRENVRMARRTCKLEPKRRDLLVWQVHSCRGACAAALTVSNTDEARVYCEEALPLAFEICSADPSRDEHVELLRRAGTESAGLAMTRGDMQALERAAERMGLGAELAERYGNRSLAAQLLGVTSTFVGCAALSGSESIVQKRIDEGVAALAAALHGVTDESQLVLAHEVLAIAGWRCSGSARDHPLVLFCRALLETGAEQQARWFLRRGLSSETDPVELESLANALGEALEGPE